MLGKTSLRYLKNLKSINLSGNPLYWVSPSAFWPNKALKQLYLNKTQLEYLTNEHLRPIDDFLDTLDLHEMPNLRMDPNIALSWVFDVKLSSDCSRTYLKTHNSDCQQLKRLDFSRSPSIRKQKIPFLRSLEYLNLDDIQLNSLGRFSKIFTFETTFRLEDFQTLISDWTELKFVLIGQTGSLEILKPKSSEILMKFHLT